MFLVLLNVDTYDLKTNEDGKLSKPGQQDTWVDRI